MGSVTPPPDDDVPLHDEDNGHAPIAKPESVITNPTPKLDPEKGSLAPPMDVSLMSGAELATAQDNAHARAHAVSLLSGVYALFVILLAFAFEISVVVSPDIHSSKYDPFYIYLYLVSIAFMAYVQVFLLRYGEVKVPVLSERFSKFKMPEKMQTLTMIRNKASHSAPEGAGSLFLRLGMIVFGVIGVIYYCLDLFGCAAGAACTGSKIASQIFGTLFMFAQMYFIFQNSKLTIHRFKHVGRLGLMHLVATNLSVWIRLIVDEQFLDAEHASSSSQKSRFIRNFRMLPKSCHQPSGGKDEAFLRMDCYLADFKPLLTTAVIEYSLICAAVAFILWKNIGFCPPGGEITGKRKESFRVDCSATIKGMFAGLVFAILAIISMVIFFIKIRLDEELDALWIFYSTDAAFYLVCILVTVWGAVLVRRLPYVGGPVSGLLLLDDILLFVGLIGQLLFSIFSIVSLDHVDGLSLVIVAAALLRIIQVLLQTIFILAGQRLAALSPEAQKEKPGRQLVIFLLIANLAFFLINTFETQKAMLNPVMVSFYGRTAWAIIVHSAVPLTIFYRFHSAVCLAEIWKLAYRVKASTAL